MLNKKKVTSDFTSFDTTDNSDKLSLKNNFFQISKFSKNNYIQTDLPKKLELGFNSVFIASSQRVAKVVPISPRFNYKLKNFKNFYIYETFKKKSIKIPVLDLKSLFVLLFKNLKESKKISYFLLKQIKGGYMISILGTISFVPRSLYRIGSLGQIINLKLFQKQTRKFAKRVIKINIVSSLKLRKRKN